MFRRFAVASVLAVVAIAGCAAPPPEAPVVDLAAEAQAIRDASALWLEAAKERDGVTIDGFFTAGATTIFDGVMLQGLPAIQANREMEWAEEPQGDIDWQTSEVIVAASGDLAIERGSWTKQDLDDDEIETGEYLTVWTKIDGHWLVLYDAGTEIEDEDDEELDD
jgi:ketosteroid isomerase-like protein